MAQAPSAAFTSLLADQAALSASLRTFAHAERLFAAVAEALDNRACVENGAIYVRDDGAIVPWPLVKLTRTQVVDSLPGVNVTFRAGVVKSDGTVEPVKQAEPPPPPPTLDLGPRGDSATAGTLQISEGLSAITLRYDTRGILSGAGSAAQPLDAWVARIVALAPARVTSYRFHRAPCDVSTPARALAAAAIGLRRQVAACTGPYLAIDAHESRALAPADSRAEAVKALADGLFRSRLRARDGRLVTPSTLSAITLAVPSRRELPAGFDRWQWAVGAARGLVRLAVRDDHEGATLVGEEVFDRGHDLSGVPEDIERALRDHRDFMTTYHAAQGDHEVLEIYRTSASVAQLVFDDKGKLRFSGATYGGTDTSTLDGDVVSERVVRVCSAALRDV